MKNKIKNKMKKAKKNQKCFEFDPFLFDKVISYYRKITPSELCDEDNLTMQDLYNIFKQMQETGNYEKHCWNSSQSDKD